LSRAENEVAIPDTVMLPQIAKFFQGADAMYSKAFCYQELGDMENESKMWKSSKVTNYFIGYI